MYLIPPTTNKNFVQTWQTCESGLTMVWVQGLCTMTLHFHADKEANERDNRHERTQHTKVCTELPEAHLALHNIVCLWPYMQIQRVKFTASAIKDKVQMMTLSTTSSSFMDVLYCRLIQREVHTGFLHFHQILSWITILWLLYSNKLFRANTINTLSAFVHLTLSVKFFHPYRTTTFIYFCEEKAVLGND